MLPFMENSVFLAKSFPIRDCNAVRYIVSRLLQHDRLMTGHIRGSVTKFPELWYSTVMVGYMTTLT